MSQLVKCDKIGEAIIRAMHSSEENTDKLCKAIYFPVSDEPIFDGGMERPTEAKYYVVGIKSYNADGTRIEQGDKVYFTIELDRPVEDSALMLQVNLGGSQHAKDGGPSPIYLLIQVGQNNGTLAVQTHGGHEQTGIRSNLTVSGDQTVRIANSWSGSTWVYH